MRYIIINLNILLLICNFKNYSQEVKTKDGVSLGDPKTFIANCVNAANEKLISVKGIKIDSKQLF